MCRRFRGTEALRVTAHATRMWTPAYKRQSEHAIIQASHHPGAST
jgi:hypothetical protein